MAKYAELFEGARVVFNKENRDGFNLRDAIATVVDMSPCDLPEDCVIIQLDETPSPRLTDYLSDYNAGTRTFCSNTCFLTLLPSQPLPEIHTLEDFL